ncbi:MAG: hypothetical protein A2W31_17165 [Planctomycetes bacterium RBG_16_64_10]|nr:MAG: hypothetical protein A2W31_17165 [Planctomycetes bacterium RBG_16_64_10]
MIVDDEPFNVMIVRKYLKQAGYQQFITTSESTEAIPLVRQAHPDLMLLDINMPVVDGFAILRSMRDDSRLEHIPVLILTASADSDTKLQALEAGATDFLAKPVDPSEMLLRVRNTLMIKAYQNHLEHYAERLELQVRLRTAQLEASRREVIHCLARAAEYRDQDTGNHVIRMSKYVGVIARQLGMDRARVELLEEAAQLHDVGKIGVSDTILLKPGKLDRGEYALMQEHCEYGRKIIEASLDANVEAIKRHTEMGKSMMEISSSPVMRVAAIIAYSHHEHWDGGGYPRGLSGDNIPIEGRIAAVADVFDAVSSERPYKPPFPQQRSLEIIQQGRGTHFDPQVVDAFLARRDEVLKIQADYADPR